MKTISNSQAGNTMQNLETFFSPIAARFQSVGKVFQTSTSHYFYDTGTGKVIQCSATMYKILKCWESSNDFKSALGLTTIPGDELVKELSELRGLVDEESIMQAIPIEKLLLLDADIDTYINTHVSMVTLELTERCNLRCRYCIYQKHDKSFRGFGERDMSFETAKKAIDLLVCHSTELGADEKLVMTFYGGEPLYKFDLIKQCVEYAESINVDREWLFSITTNCTLLTDEMISFFANKSFMLTASIDGDRETHNANRINAGGVGSFDRAIRNYEKLAKAYKEHGVGGQHLCINSVITPPYDFEKLDRMQSFFNNLEWLPEDAKITWAYAQPDHEITKEELDLNLARIEIGDAEDLDPITEWHYKMTTSSEHSLFTQEGETRALMRIQGRQITNKPTNNAHMNACCVPGSRRVYVTVDGSLKVCERIGESPDIGNVYDGFDFASIRRRFFDEYTEHSLPYCKDCWSVQLCSVCYMHCYSSDGVDMDKKNYSCAKTKFSNERALVGYHELLENYPDRLMKHLGIVE